MFLTVTFDEILERLGGSELVHADEFIPSAVPLLDHNPYRPEYGWLFTYERRLGRILDKWLLAHRHELIGTKGLLSEALSNAYCHGNRRDDEAPISIEVYVGRHGVAITIRDRGAGFDRDRIIEQAAAGKKGYFQIGGNGMRRMHESDSFGVLFDDDGRMCVIVHLFDGELATLAPLGRRPSS